VIWGLFLEPHYLFLLPFPTPPLSYSPPLPCCVYYHFIRAVPHLPSPLLCSLTNFTFRFFSPRAFFLANAPFARLQTPLTSFSETPPLLPCNFLFYSLDFSTLKSCSVWLPPSFAPTPLPTLWNFHRNTTPFCVGFFYFFLQASVPPCSRIILSSCP